jgi:hypothetical protein
MSVEMVMILMFIALLVLIRRTECVMLIAQHQVLGVMLLRGHQNAMGIGVMIMGIVNL